MFKNKKGQGLSLNTIIIASIVLIVLVVLIMIFTGQMGNFIRGLFNESGGKTCEELGGVARCTEDMCAITDRIVRPARGLAPGEVCCKVPCGSATP